MKRLILLAAACYLLIPAGVASAHPLGNFTINRFARVEVAGHRLYVRYVVDMAEIPTLQHVPIRIGALHVSVDGRPVALHVTKTALAHPKGAAGLRTTRFQALLAGPEVEQSAQRVGRRPQLRRPHRLEGDRPRRHGPIDIGRAARLPEGSPSQPARRDPRRRAAHAQQRRPADPAHRPRAGRARPDRRLELRLADRPQAPERAGRAHLARARRLLGRRARPVARPRQDDRLRLSRRLARHAVARGAARVDHDSHAHGRCLRTGRDHAAALAVDRPGHALSVARPERGADGRRCRRRRPLQSDPARSSTPTRPRSSSPSPRRERAAQPARRRDLRRAAAVPLGARRAAGCDLTAPRRLRNAARLRVQPRACGRDHPRRPGRGDGEEHVRALRRPRTLAERPPGGQRTRDCRSRARPWSRAPSRKWVSDVRSRPVGGAFLGRDDAR